MKALMMILTVSVTLVSMTSHAELVKAPCGRVFNKQNVLRDSSQGNFYTQASRSKSVSQLGGSQSTAVQSEN